MSKKDNPDFDVRLPEWNGADPHFEFSEEMRKGTLLGGKSPHRVAPVDKRISVHGKASTCDSLLGVHPNAIVIGGPAGTGEIKFMMALYMVLTALGCIMFGLFSLKIFSNFSWEMSDVEYVVAFMAFLIFATIFLFISSMFFLKLAFFVPRDLPIIFNRVTREVSFFTVIPARFWKFWQFAGVGGVRTYKWDEVHARSYQLNELTGEAMRSSYLLALLWGDSDNPSQCKEIITIGYKGWWEDELLWRLYEHIRRYMEENGPPIQAGESFRKFGIGKLPQFYSEIIIAAGGPALSDEEVYRLAEAK